MTKFKSIDSFTVQGRRCFCVENPEECSNFDHIIGHEVEIDGSRFKVSGVERSVHMPPWLKGEMIALAVEPTDKAKEGA